MSHMPSLSGPRLFMLLQALPSVLTAASVFAAGWFTFHPPDIERRATIEIVAGSALLLLCAGSFEFFSHWSFNLLGLSSKLVRADKNNRQRLSIITGQSPEIWQNVRAQLVDTGELPVVLLAWQSPDRLWISTDALRRWDDHTLWLLAGGELARQRLDSMLDRVLVCGGFWWAAVLAVMLLNGNPYFAAGWFCIALVVFLGLLNFRARSIERRAGIQCMEGFGLRDYALALAKAQLALHPGNQRIAVSRLNRIGLSVDEAAALVREAVADQAGVASG